MNYVDPSGMEALLAGAAIGICVVALIAYVGCQMSLMMDDLEVAADEIAERVSEAAECAGNWVAAQNTKHKVKQAEGSMGTAIEHLNTLRSSPPGDPSRSHWIGEIVGALREAQKWADRMPSGLRDTYTAKIAALWLQLDALRGGQ